jgi:hypothetical protein
MKTWTKCDEPGCREPGDFHPHNGNRVSKVLYCRKHKKGGEQYMTERTAILNFGSDWRTRAQF